VVLGCLSTCVSPALAKRPSDRELVNKYAEIEGKYLGETLPGGPEAFIKVTDSPKYSETVHEYGKTFTAGALTSVQWDSSGSEAIGATITIYGIARSGSEGQIAGVAAHEVFHVFEARMSPDKAVSEGHQAWLQEGAAGWVESELAPGDPIARRAWTEYLESPRTELFKRDYDGVGFFGHMVSSHIDPWGKFKAMFDEASSPAAYAAAGVDKSFLDDEASAFFHEPSLGSEWAQKGRNVPSKLGFKPTQVNVGSKAVKPIVVNPYTDGAYVLSISGLPIATPVLEVTVVKGNVRVRSTSGGHVDEVDPGQVLLCSDPKGCSCPTRPNHYLDFERGNLAITGGPTGGEVKLVKRKPCEVLLPGASCETLLPGFMPLIKSVDGKPTSTEVRRADGTTDSACAFLYKGTEVAAAEGEGTMFMGVTAPVINVLRSSSIGGAITYYKLISVPIRGFQVSHPKIGDEAVLLTASGVSPKGEVEYVSSAVVRVHNIVVNYSLYGSPGNNEADPEQSLRLLAQVASKL